MTQNFSDRGKETPHSLDISDEDVLEAMKEIEGYLDITPGDFKTLYRLALKHAIQRITYSVKARDVMTREVIAVKRDTPSGEVANLMATHGIAGVPVLEDDKKVVGVISEKDFLFHLGSKETRSFMDVISQCLRNKGCVAITMRQQKAEDIMTSPAKCVGEDTPVAAIAEIFTQENINRVPVIDREGGLISIVARADVLQSSFPREIDIERSQ